MRARKMLTVMAGTVSLLVVSCGGEEGATGQSTTASRTSTTESVPVQLIPCGDDEGSPLAKTDGSIEAKLAQAHVTDDMVCGLGEVSDAAGYGFDSRATTFEERQGFAYVALDNCREAASGYVTWDEIIADEVAQGAPRRASSTLNGYLRDVYCPAVLLGGEEAAPPATGVSDPVDAKGMRGIYSNITWYDGRFEPLPLSECTSRLGEFMLDEGRAYRFDDDTVLCVDVPSADHGGLDAPTRYAELAFRAPQSEESALAKAMQLVPEDAAFDSRVVATNAEGPNSCLSVDYRSARVGERAREGGPKRDSSPEYINVHLYSERQSDLGSSSPYDGTVSAAYLSSSRDNDTNDPAC